MTISELDSFQTYCMFILTDSSLDDLRNLKLDDSAVVFAKGDEMLPIGSNLTLRLENQSINEDYKINMWILQINCIHKRGFVTSIDTLSKL